MLLLAQGVAFDWADLIAKYGAMGLVAYLVAKSIPDLIKTFREEVKDVRANADARAEKLETRIEANQQAIMAGHVLIARMVDAVDSTHKSVLELHNDQRATAEQWARFLAVEEERRRHER